MVGVNLMATVFILSWFRQTSLIKLLSMQGRYKIQIEEAGNRHVFSKKEGEICKSRQAGALQLPVKRRHQLVSMFYFACSVDEHKHSPAID